MTSSSSNIAMVDVSTKRFPGMFTLIDECDLPLMHDGKARWFATRVKADSNSLYVVRRAGGKFQLLHRVILGLSDRRVMGDHRNGDTLDNRRENLRASTNQQNSQNGVTHSDSTSKFKGVSWDKQRGKWAAGIGISGKRISLGRFDSEHDAARAYDAAALKNFGDFARLNFPG
jgi:hypothetical protein